MSHMYVMSYNIFMSVRTPWERKVRMSSWPNLENQWPLAQQTGENWVTGLVGGIRVFLCLTLSYSLSHFLYLSYMPCYSLPPACSFSLSHLLSGSLVLSLSPPPHLFNKVQNHQECFPLFLAMCCSHEYFTALGGIQPISMQKNKGREVVGWQENSNSLFCLLCIKRSAS